MPKNNSLNFRLKVSQKELEIFLLKLLQADNQIGTQEEKFYTGMLKVGQSYFLEFSVPILPETIVENKEVV